MKAWLIALAAAAGLTGMASSLSQNDDGVRASSGRGMESARTERQGSPSVQPEPDHKNRGRGMMDGMMGMMGRMMDGGMMSGGGMMDGCPMMNDRRPNDQWQPGPPAR